MSYILPFLIVLWSSERWCHYVIQQYCCSLYLEIHLSIASSQLIISIPKLAYQLHNKMVFLYDTQFITGIYCGNGFIWSYWNHFRSYKRSSSLGRYCYNQSLQKTLPPFWWLNFIVICTGYLFHVNCEL